MNLLDQHSPFRRDVGIVQLKSHKLFQPYYSIQFGEDDGSFMVVTRPRNLEESSYDTYRVIFGNCLW